jgi:predicted DCC family thiol-disulfide oxidoreductase YuxK
VNTHPARPVVVFDGECGFCRVWIDRWHERAGDRIEFIPYQDPSVADRFPNVPRQAFATAVHLFEPDGRVSSGARAVFRLRAWTRDPHRGAERSSLATMAYESVPGVRPITETAYRFVADHRRLFMALTRLLWGRAALRPTYARSMWLFRRVLAVVFLFAFWSISTQIVGLVGEHGIVPAGPSDQMLLLVCRSGIGLSLLALAGVAPIVMFPLLWAGYLSLSALGGNFLSYQWDALLLETGALAIFIAPIAWRDRWRDAGDPPRLATRLLMWLLFRLIAGSGVMKLASGDPTWRNLTALSFHFETQPIPTPIAWYAHQLPLPVLKAATAGMFAIELGAPLLFVLPRRPRLLAAIAITVLQLVIALTGNYAFFNLLTIALCLALVDDAAIVRVLRLHSALSVPAMRRAIPHALVVAVALVTVPASIPAFVRTFGVAQEPWPVVGGLEAAIAPLRSVNTYGLFAAMTTERPEIEIQGSEDGVTWQPYEFRYKAGDPVRRPPWVAPHQPRLDWDMWFAALSPFYAEPWFEHFRQRLLEASPDVLPLLARDPFNGRRPRAIRAVVYRYRFSTRAERASSGAWWVREPLGRYAPDVGPPRTSADAAPPVR